MAARIEKDTLGPVEVPEESYYGAQTARAVTNFPISGLKPHPALVRATVVIKKCAAKVNMDTGRLDRKIGEAIVSAADEALAGAFSGDFVVDPFQAGAGTSHNMNINEVLANRAVELLGGSRGEYRPVHPNDHVNMAQSTNDVFPTSIRLAALSLLPRLEKNLEALAASFRRKGEEFDSILKSGRTHLQDAVPIRLGQEFRAYSGAIEGNLRQVRASREPLLDLGIGGTAVGTGLNAEKRFIPLVVAEIAAETGLPVRSAPDLVEAMQNMDPFVGLSSSLKGTALNLARICADLRLLASGPRTGFNEITLPAMQPGSSIMPGKVNPVLAEMTSMVSFQVIGNDTCIGMAAQAGVLELNVMMPVIAFSLLFSLEILTNAVGKLSRECIDGIVAHPETCRKYLETSLGMATILAPKIGYVAAAEVVKEAGATGRSITEVAVSRGFITAAEMARLLDPYPLTNPGVPGREEA